MWRLSRKHCDLSNIPLFIIIIFFYIDYSEILRTLFYLRAVTEQILLEFTVKVQIAFEVVCVLL